MRKKWNDIPYVIIWFITFIVMLIMVFGCSEDKVVGNKIKQDTVIFVIDSIWYKTKSVPYEIDSSEVCGIGGEGV